MAKQILKDVFYPGLFSDDEKKYCTMRSWYPLAYAVAAKHDLFIVKDAAQQKEIAIGNASGFTVVVVGMSNVGRRLRGYDKELAYYVRTNRTQILVSTKLNYMLRKVNAGGDVQLQISRRIGNGNMITALKDLATHYDRQIRSKAEVRLGDHVANALLDIYDNPKGDIKQEVHDEIGKIIKERKTALIKQNRYIGKRTTMFTPPKWVAVYTSFGWHVGKVQFNLMISPVDECEITEMVIQEIETPKLYKTWRDLPDDIKAELISKLVIIKTARGNSETVDPEGLIPPDNTYTAAEHGCLSAKHPTDGAYFLVVNV